MKLHRLTAQLVVGAILTLPVWAHAAGLGKLTVKSALGQTLSAEIELFVADKSELDSLNASMAADQAFKDAQIDYAPVLSTLQLSIGKGAGGKPVLKLTSSKPINDPFMDMLVELNWASGRLLREYTILLDPPGVAVPQTVSPVAVNVPMAKPAPTPASVEVVPQPTPVNQFAVATEPAAQKPAAMPEAAITEQAVPSESQVQVKSGDTLSKIANRVRPAHISLEQALVSLFNENPDAFQGNNMNRLKAGRELSVPSAEAMAGVDQQSARDEINLQAADWQAYRAKLAESVADQPVQEKEVSKAVVGKITPKVDDKAQPKAEAAKDVLKLSRAATATAAATTKAQAEQKAAQEKAAAEAKAAAAAKAQAEEEDRLAREKALKESAERAAALEKQIQDMQKLAAMKEQAKAAEATAEQGAQTPPPAPAPKVKAKPPVVAEEPQANWYDELLENPIYWIGGLGVVVLGGLLWWMVAGGRLRRKKMTGAVTDSLITGGDLQPNSVVGAAATGGVVNTGDTSFLTDFSQAGLAEIDTHDVDPIAEADVYMAYGRDAQAEEILKEALTKSPDRHEIRLKLLEIYSARKNVTAFETVAGQLYASLGGQPGVIWDKAMEMGRAIDPHNPLYGGKPEPAMQAPMAAPPVKPADVKPVEAKPIEAPAAPAVSASAGGLLDFSSETPDLGLNLSVPEFKEKPKAEEPAPAKPAQDLDFDLSGFDLKVPEEAPSAAPAPAPAMDFSGLDLGLNDMGGEDEFDEVSTKLDLARAYLEMGDKEGAREILQEVISEGNDQQKSDAKGIMASL